MPFHSCWDSISGTNLLPNEDDQTRLRNRLGEQNLANLMRIAIEMPENLPDDIVESVVDICAGSSTRRVIPRRRPDSTRKI